MEKEREGGETGNTCKKIRPFWTSTHLVCIMTSDCKIEPIGALIASAPSPPPPILFRDFSLWSAKTFKDKWRSECTVSEDIQRAP